jgi:hypothetical protein
MLFETKNFTYLYLSKAQRLPLLEPYLFSSEQLTFLEEILASQVEYCTLQQQIYA